MELTGQRFGQLSVLRRAPNRGRRVAWHCLCDCGNMCVVNAAELRRADTKSCGCYHKKRASEANLTHGKAATRIYSIWRTMIRRCDSPKDRKFDQYGGRGIRVCDDWRDVNRFAAWAHANGYAEDLTIDRVDNDGGYDPTNCRWATWSEQNRNRRPYKLRFYPKPWKRKQGGVAPQ